MQSIDSRCDIMQNMLIVNGGVGHSVSAVTVAFNPINEFIIIFTNGIIEWFSFIKKDKNINYVEFIADYVADYAVLPTFVRLLVMLHNFPPVDISCLCPQQLLSNPSVRCPLIIFSNSLCNINNNNVLFLTNLFVTCGVENIIPLLHILKLSISDVEHLKLSTKHVPPGIFYCHFCRFNILLNFLENACKSRLLFVFLLYLFSNLSYIMY
jgi:hypothetical protein